MNPITISRQTARRFVLCKQGLWPGRRWKGKKGTAQASRACEAVQLDPLNAVVRSQDIVLHSRVLDYKPNHLYQVMYKERGFLDYGGWQCQVLSFQQQNLRRFYPSEVSMLHRSLVTAY